MQRANADQNIQHVAFTVEVAVEMQTDVPDVRVLVRELLLKFLAKPNVRLTSGGGHSGKNRILLCNSEEIIQIFSLFLPM